MSDSDRVITVRVVLHQDSDSDTWIANTEIGESNRRPADYEEDASQYMAVAGALHNLAFRMEQLANRLHNFPPLALGDQVDFDALNAWIDPTDAA